MTVLKDVLQAAVLAGPAFGVKTIIVGGLAVQKWYPPHEIRPTYDVDIILPLFNPEDIEHFTDLIFTNSFIKCRAVSVVEATPGLLSIATLDCEDVTLDVLIPHPDIYRQLARRAKPEKIMGVEAKIAGPSDLLALKLTSWRPKDWPDIAVLLKHAKKALVKTLCAILGTSGRFEQVYHGRFPFGPN